MKRFALLFLLLLAVLPISVSALGGEEMTPFLDAIPEEARDALPGDVVEELRKGDGADPEVLSRLLDGGFFLRLLSDGVKNAAHPFFSVLGKCVGLLLLSALVSLVGKSAGGEGGKPMRMLTTLLLSLSVWELLSGALDVTVRAITAVTVFMRAMLPAMLALYAAGGDLSAGASEEGMLTLFFGILSFLCSDLLLPLTKLLFVMGILTRISPENDLSGLTGTFRKCFLTGITFLSVLLCTVLGCQHTLAARADGMLTRTVKFASASLIPVVGGSASEAMRTAMESVRFLRSAVGGLGTAVILILLLSPFAALFLYKAGFSAASGIAGALGCTEEGSFFRESEGILDLSLGLLTMTALVFLFSLSVFIRCATALGA